MDSRSQLLRIDNRRQSTICASLHCSLTLFCTLPYDIPNDSLYFCLPDHINYVMIYLIFRELLIFNHFFDFYFLNMDISLNISFSEMKFCTLGHKISLEGSISQNFDKGLSFYFISKKRETFGYFLELFFQDSII